MKDSLTPAEAVEMLTHVCDGMIASEPLLTDADRAIGDGDHGIGIKRGFEAAKEALGGGHETLDAAFKAVGMAMISSMGGASGAVFGTLFRNGGKALAGSGSLDGAALGAFLNEGLEGVMKRGGAKPGDKTIIDALDPAASAVKGAGGSFSEAIAAAVAAAEQGVEATKDMVATTGKARALGDRSKGHPDPGAISMTLILKFMGEYAAR